jgi:hypothetical protein
VAITRMDWRLHGDLLEWIATTFPGLSNAQFEAGYRLLANPSVTDEAAEHISRHSANVWRRAIRVD